MIEIDKNIFKILNIIYLSQFLVKSKLYYFLVDLYFLYLFFYTFNFFVH